MTPSLRDPSIADSKKESKCCRRFGLSLVPKGDKKQCYVTEIHDATDSHKSLDEDVSPNIEDQMNSEVK
jgi:hypothetical protein